MICEGAKGLCRGSPYLGRCTAKHWRVDARGGNSERKSAVFRGGVGTRFSGFLKVAVKHLLVLGKEAEEMDLGIDPRLVSGAKEFGKIAAFSEWFRLVAFVLASADLLPLINGLSGGLMKEMTLERINYKNT